jgi:hypothetical protein
MNTQSESQQDTSKTMLNFSIRVFSFIGMFLFLTMPAYVVLVYNVEHQWILGIQQLASVYHNPEIYTVANIIFIVAFVISLVASILT